MFEEFVFVRRLKSGSSAWDDARLRCDELGRDQDDSKS